MARGDDEWHPLIFVISYGVHTLAAPDDGLGNAFPDSEEGNAPCLEEEEESANAGGHKARVVETDAIASSLTAHTATNPHISATHFQSRTKIAITPNCKTRFNDQEPNKTLHLSPLSQGLELKTNLK